MKEAIIDSFEQLKYLNMAQKKGTGQTKNPRTGKYVKIDRDKGRIISTKKSEGPYKNVPVIRKKKD